MWHCGQALRNPRALRSGSEDWGLRAHCAPGPRGAGTEHRRAESRQPYRPGQERAPSPARANRCGASDRPAYPPPRLILIGASYFADWLPLDPISRLEPYFRMGHRTLASIPALWASIPCPRSELRLDLVLAPGQSFRWREQSPAHWSGVLADQVWTLTQTEEQLYCTVYRGDKSQVGKPTLEELKAVRQYFQLDVSLAQLYRHWSSVDPHFQEVAQKFQGVRLLQQDPIECLFSFICSSNNNIARIAGMVERLCQAFGPRLIQLDDVAYHGFPSLQALAGPEVEAQLRKLGLGYRARYVNASARAILEEQGGLSWLQQLRKAPYEEAHKALCNLPGVGTKVADCICLMALDKPQAVPVDVHVWQIAQRDYSWHPTTTQAKGPSPQANKELGNFFRSLWGPYAGWAQAVLFSADLRQPQRAQEPPAKRRKRSTEPES